MREWFRARNVWGAAIHMLTDEEAGRLMKALWEYTMTGHEASLRGAEKGLYALILITLHQDEERDKAISQKRVKSGMAGGRPKKANALPEAEEKANVSQDANEEASAIPEEEEKANALQEPDEKANADNKNKRKNKNKEKEKETEQEYLSLFAHFWAEYPRKVCKKDAVRAWGKLKPDGELFAVIMENLRKQKKCDDWKRDDGQYIPYPATWLNGQRWEDEVKQHYRKVQVSAQDYGQRDYDAEYWAEYEAREQREIEEKIRRMEEEKSALLLGKEEADAMVLGGSGERDHPAGDMGLPVLPVAGTA